ncbi:hypothetical protein QBC45DRAFT_309083, partial [Copromyces sp. CBS 386.78]
CLYIGLDVDIAILVSMVVTGGSPFDTVTSPLVEIQLLHAQHPIREHVRDIHSIQAKAIGRT